MDAAGLLADGASVLGRVHITLCYLPLISVISHTQALITGVIY
jgi:hypothetical protein